jgi:hypothetical protein
MPIFNLSGGASPVSIIFWHSWDRETNSRPTIFVRVFELGENSVWDARASIWRDYVRSHTFNVSIGTNSVETQTLPIRMNSMDTQTPQPNSTAEAGLQTQQHGGPEENSVWIPNPRDPWEEDVYVAFAPPSTDLGTQTDLQLGGMQLLIDLVDAIPRSITMAPIRLKFLCA